MSPFNPTEATLGAPQSLVASAAHRHQPPFATGDGHGSRADLRAQSVIIALREWFRRFCEHRGSDFSSDSWQGFENGDVAILAAFGCVTWPQAELVQQALDLLPTGLSLRVHHFEARQDQTNLRDRGIDDARRSRILRKFWRRRPDLSRGWRFCRAIPGGFGASDAVAVLAANHIC